MKVSPHHWVIALMLVGFSKEGEASYLAEAGPFISRLISRQVPQINRINLFQRSVATAIPTEDEIITKSNKVLNNCANDLAVHKPILGDLAREIANSKDNLSFIKSNGFGQRELASNLRSMLNNFYYQLDSGPMDEKTEEAVKNTHELVDMLILHVSP